VTVIHEALLDAVQAHPAVVLTSVVPVPPSAGTLSSCGEIEKLHDGDGAGGGVGAGGVGLLPAAWETVNVRPAMVMVPVLAAPVLFATLKATEPLPVPAAPDVTVIHVAPLVAVH
jgi:hypothetical protein